MSPRFHRVAALVTCSPLLLVLPVAARAQPATCRPVVDHVEWTQGVQGPLNDVSLVVGRDVTIRVYPKLSPECLRQGVFSIPGVQAYRDTVGPYEPSENGPLTVDTASRFDYAHRMNPNGSFNFTEPLDWTNNYILVCLTPSDPQLCEEWFYRDKPVYTVDAPRILGVPVRYNAFDAPPRAGIVPGLGDRGLRAVLPYPESPGIYDLYSDATGSFDMSGSPPWSSCSSSQWIRLKDLGSADPEYDYVYRCLQPGVLPFNWQGVGCSPLGVALGTSSGPYWMLTFPHEVLHLLPFDLPDRASEPISAFGWDMPPPAGRLRDGRVKVPDKHVDLMGRGWDHITWIDKPDYTKVLSTRFRPMIRRQVMTVPIYGPALITGTWSIGYAVNVSRVGRPIEPRDTGQLELRLRDSLGAITYATFVEAPSLFCGLGCVGPGSAQVSVPGDADAARIELVRDGAVVAARDRSPNPPTVSIISPTPGSSLVDGTVVAWNALDADSDALQADVHFSPDGEPSIPLEVLAAGSTLTLTNTARLPAGGDGRLRVIVSDGFNTTIAEVGGLYVGPHREPEAFIAEPATGSVFHAGSHVIFHGSGEDPEDGWLLGGALVWSSSLVGYLGTRDTLATHSLPVGSQVVTLEATDSTGASASQATLVTIQ